LSVAEDWVSTVAGRHLSGRRKQNTAPEVAFRKALHAVGVRFRLHRTLAKGCTPDILLPSRHLAVFVDGCFWHGCPEHGRKTPWSGPNAELWAAKMARNRERDEYSTNVAERLGWKVFRIWECEIRARCSGVVAEVLGGGPLRPSR
jgi:DNA mismatch endonuclease (patch repair protein)